MNESILSPRRNRIRQLTEAGLTPRQIAKALDISTQAVYQNLHKLGIAPAAKATK